MVWLAHARSCLSKLGRHTQSLLKWDVLHARWLPADAAESPVGLIKHRIDVPADELGDVFIEAASVREVLPQPGLPDGTSVPLQNCMHGMVWHFAVCVHMCASVCASASASEFD